MSSITTNQAEFPFILSIDIGTSSVRASLFDRFGRSIGKFSQSFTSSLSLFGFEAEPSLLR